MRSTTSLRKPTWSSRGLKGDMEAFLERRLAETGLPDPTLVQDITMRRIGDKSRAVPL